MKCSLTLSRISGMPTSCALRAFAAAAMLAGSVPASAQALISPVVVELGPKHKIATVRISLSEKAIKPMRLQAQLLQWRQDLHGQAVTQPSADLIVAPRIAEVKPGQQQILRVALRGSLPGETEKAYRLVLEDIAPPSSMTLGGGAAVNFRMAYDLPVMVAPQGAAVTAIRWRPCAADAAPPTSNGMCVHVANVGNRRVKIQSVTVRGDGWQHELKLKEADAILAGAEREWLLPASAGARLREVEVRTVTGEVLRAEPSAG